ncbi:hypothetical protein [Clostridium sp. ZS2-4]|uniref:hypothetical protein n=1 Tax=Clostridium sp. ZS2-4 TaxID=2987703 RepID=UPI00227C171C|nr:hypothetical protein [Clostridium sp. ZS2-4]MCY6353776.1 hypothetical protein [Clostridium sp. ZS2-4]
MSTLALSGNGMVLPSNYVEIDREEMTYIEEGWNWSIFRNNMIGLAAFGVSVGYLGQKALKVIGSNTVYLRVVAAASPYVAKIGSFFGGWIGAVVFVGSAAAAIYYLGNKKVFY